LPKIAIAEERSKSLLDPTYGWYMHMMFVCCGIIVFYLVIGSIKDQYERSKAKRIYKHSKNKDDGGYIFT